MATARRSTFPFLVALTALFISSTGCPNGAGDTDTDERAVWRTCTQDSECPGEHFICDREMLRCVCTSDEACPAGLYCNMFTGLCVADVPGCSTNEDCDVGQYCDLGTRTCRARRSFCEPCSTHVECGSAADRCLLDPTNNRSYCGKACSIPEDCPDGATCLELDGERSCWPSIATCEQFRGCNPNSGQLCQSSDDCTEGEDQVCDETQGQCVARVPSCPHGMVCSRETHRCEAACVTDEDCYTTDPSCDVETNPCRCTNNECVGISMCRANGDCPAGRVCVIEPGQDEGECRPDCQGDDSRCPPGHLCQNVGARYDCVEGCRTNADCAVSQNCVGGRCRAETSTGVQYCQMSEVCELCQVCRSDGGASRTCQRHEETCKTCHGAPRHGCSALSPPIFCCAVFTTTGYRGIDCSDGQLCPAGHQCVDIKMGGTIYGNCVPTSDFCQAPSCGG